jgi:hypothetical protein
MAVDPDRAWDWLLECADGFDESCADRSKTWPPPIMAPLARAAATSGLRRFYPWLSHNLMRLSIPCDDWIMRPNVAPAFAGVGPNPDRYVVWEGELFSGPTEVTLETPDPVRAVTELERLLAAWP